MSVQIIPNTLASRMNGVASTKAPILARVVWYQPSGEERPKTTSIVSKFSQNGMDVRVVRVDDEMLEQLTKVDLVMVEVTGRIDEEINMLLDDIRSNSHAPVVLLTDNYTLEWSIATLVAGADAVVTVNTPDEVIIARCKALLRRWLPGT
jgi:DNA-binding response OmpR family regulator